MAKYCIAMMQCFFVKKITLSHRQAAGVASSGRPSSHTSACSRISGHRRETCSLFKGHRPRYTLESRKPAIKMLWQEYDMLQGSTPVRSFSTSSSIGSPTGFLQKQRGWRPWTPDALPLHSRTARRGQPYIRDHYPLMANGQQLYACACEACLPSRSQLASRPRHVACALALLAGILAPSGPHKTPACFLLPPSVAWYSMQMIISGEW